MEPLSDRQREVLDYIRGYVAEQTCPPSAREICRAFGFASPRAATQHVATLERKGYLRREPGRARNLRLLHAPTAIPILGQVTAGLPTLAEENIEGALDWPLDLSREKVFAVRVKGESMRGAGILDGDFAIVRAQSSVPNGAIAVASIEGETTVKRVFKTRRGYRLQPANDAFAPIEVSPATPDFRIVGLVVSILRRQVQ